MATIGMLRRLASATAIAFAHRVDDDDRVRQLLHVADAIEIALELLALALHRRDLLLAHLAEYSGCFSRSSMYFIRAMLLRIVVRLVSVPPSQRWFT